MKDSVQFFHNQHVQIRQIMSEMILMLGGRRGDPERLHQLLVQLAGTLKGHLALEDLWLYPQLLRHRESRVRRATQSLMTEVGDLAVHFDAYLNKWNGVDLIRMNPEPFASDSRHILEELTLRIDREEESCFEHLLEKPPQP